MRPVRTYVHHDGRNPGVWFFSLDVANRLAVWIARTFWHLLYHRARMTLEAGEAVRHASRRRRRVPWHDASDRRATRRAPGRSSTSSPSATSCTRSGTTARSAAARFHHTPYPAAARGALGLGRVAARDGACPERAPARARRRVACDHAIARAAAPLCFHVASVTFMLSG